MRTQICKKCPQEIIFLRTRDQRWDPVNVESLSDADKHELRNNYKVLFDPKRHVSHFSNCPGAPGFRKQKTEPQQSFFEKDPE
jgi:hypothetical protein